MKLANSVQRLNPSTAENFANSIVGDSITFNLPQSKFVTPATDNGGV